jgi:hypothetical protein
LETIKQSFGGAIGDHEIAPTNCNYYLGSGGWWGIASTVLEARLNPILVQISF